MSLQGAATQILRALANAPRDVIGQAHVDGKSLAEVSGLTPAEINDAVSLLVRSGYAEWRQWMGTAPFIFGTVEITPIGRYENERASSVFGSPPALDKNETSSVAPNQAITLPPTPIGSPYGFTDHDWEYIAERKDRSDQLIVVLGYQFTSPHYDSASLKANLKEMFDRALSSYHAGSGAIPATLTFQPLAAGYGEHLFNEIARDIIASDIAVFETSDLNPNVMVELGVALTWGVRVLPIKNRDCPKPPSDISGQTWADYDNSAALFVDPDHHSKLVRMIDRAIRKKGRK